MRKKLFSANGAFLTEKSLEANEIEISINSEFATISLKWGAFLDWAEDAKNLYLLIDAMEAIVIPKSIDGFQELRQLVSNQVRRTGPALMPASRVEAMYAPEVFAEVPVAKMEVK